MKIIKPSAHVEARQLSSVDHRPLTQRGFTVLMAALVASIVLSLGLSIFSLARKSITLSSLGRESQFAFYAADTGAECALYKDIRNLLFSTTTPPTTIKCDAQTASITTQHNTPGGIWASTVFNYEYAPNGYCAKLTITKNKDNAATPVYDPSTLIHANGYNTGCSSILTNPRALERSVELRY